MTSETLRDERERILAGQPVGDRAARIWWYFTVPGSVVAFVFFVVVAELTLESEILQLAVAPIALFFLLQLVSGIGSLFAAWKTRDGRR